MTKPPTRPITVNGVLLGPGSPLAAKRTYTAPEFSVQAGLIELLVGPIGKGDRWSGGGLTGRIPSLILVYAIPNGGMAGGKLMGARRKREGQLRGMPDLCWPVARGHYHALYLEAKRPKGKARAEQLWIHNLLREQGNCVLVFDTVQMGLDCVLSYHQLLPGQALTSHA